MTAFQWLLVSTVLSVFVVCTAFPAVMLLHRALVAGVWVPAEAKATGYFWLALGVPADIGYNLVLGSIRFREFPRELMFSGRVQRHIDESDGWRLDHALQWAAFLNFCSPNHIRLVGAERNGV
jgi:hypothetical protein